VICAFCGSRTRLAPCIACSRAPLLAGRWRLLDVIGVDDDLITYQAENAQGPGPAVLVQQVPVRRRPAPAVLEAVEAALAPLRACGHPAVPRVRGVVHAPCQDFDALWIVRELLVGAPLASLLGSPWSVDEVLSLVDRLLEVQESLEACSPPVRSGSLRPDTVLLQPDGGVGIIAFAGLQAAMADPGAPARGQRAADGPWSAPEGGEVTAQSELFSTGVLAFTLLCGAPPPRARGRLDWGPLVSLPPQVGAFLDRLTEPSPARRPAGPTAARAALAALRGAPSDGAAAAEAPPLVPEPPPLPASAPAGHGSPADAREASPAPEPALGASASAAPAAPAPRASRAAGPEAVDPGLPTGSRRAPVASGPWFANPLALAIGLCLLLVTLWALAGAWRG